MKKLAIVLVIASMVVMDLMLSGMNVVAGILLITGAGIVCAFLDYCGNESHSKTSITHAARQNRRGQLTSGHESSCARQSWDGWQHCSQELQYAK